MPAHKRIDKLTAAERDAMAGHVRAWVDRALAVRPADRPIAERGIRSAYRLAGLTQPRAIVWVTHGPRWAMWACGLVERLVNAQVYEQVYEQVGEQVYEQVREQVGAQVGAQVREQVGAQVRAQVYEQVYEQVGEQVDEQVYEQVGAQVRAQVYEQVREQVREQVSEQVGEQVRAQVYEQVSEQWRSYLGGAWWASWPASYATFCRDVCRLAFSRPEQVQAAEDVTECGWWWPHRDFVVVCDRPTRLERDERGRLHSATGPSIAYGDSWALHHWHGQVIPAEWLTPGVLTPETALSQTQAEMRTAACEIVGWEKILAGLPHKVLATDPDPEIGTLISVDLPAAPDTRYVRARCGTGRWIHYRASREAKTPLEAAARSYRLKPEEYRPEVRT